MTEITKEAIELLRELNRRGTIPYREIIERGANDALHSLQDHGLASGGATLAYATKKGQKRRGE